MEITEVRIFLRDSSPNKKLRAYATITFDNVFVIRNIKIIEDSKVIDDKTIVYTFVAMPSRKIKQPCPKCGFRNEMRSKFCNQCGGQLPLAPRPLSGGEPQSSSAEHKDIAHPITQSFREYLQRKVLETYEKERSNPYERRRYAK